MTAVRFATRVQEPVGWAARWIRRQVVAGQRLAVLAPDAVLQQVSQQLWCAQPTSYLPHVLEPPPSVVALQHTPVALGAWAAELEDYPQWLQLAGPWMAPLPHCRLVLEVAGTDEGDLQEARRRWREYQRLGLTPEMLADGEPAHVR